MTAREGSNARKMPGKAQILTIPVAARSASHMNVTEGTRQDTRVDTEA